MASRPQLGVGPIEIRLPAPHPGQAIVRNQARRFNWLCAGRRWRKTTLVAPLMVEAAFSGGNYLWCAPTYKQVKVAWDEMRKMCGAAVRFRENDMDAGFPGGGRIQFVSLDDPDNARGKTADGVELDEASEASARAWYEILRPMLLDTHGWAWFTFTPKGQNWTWQEWQRAAALDDDPESVAWQVPTLGCAIEDGRLVRRPHPLENPDIPFAELQDMFARMPERTFRQEILAEFLDDAGGVFRGVAACVDGELEDGPPHRMAQYALGVDLAKHADYTAIVVMDLARRRVVGFDRFNQADWGLVKARIAAAARKWNDALVWMDSTGVGDPIYDDLRRAGLRIHPFRFTAASKQALVEAAVLLVEQRRVTFPDVPALVGEIKALQYTKSDAGHYRIGAPEGMHDDAAMAFCLACWPLAHSSATLAPQAWEQINPRAAISDVRGADLLKRTF